MQRHRCADRLARSLPCKLGLWRISDARKQLFPAMSSDGFACMESILEDVRYGRLVIVCNDHRKAEGDLSIAAKFVAPEDVAFMAVRAVAAEKRSELAG